MISLAVLTQCTSLTYRYRGFPFKLTPDKQGQLNKNQMSAPRLVILPPPTPRQDFACSPYLAHLQSYSYDDRSFAATGPHLWNSLPSHLQLSDIGYNDFKRQLKTFLLE